MLSKLFNKRLKPFYGAGDKSGEVYGEDVRIARQSKRENEEKRLDEYLKSMNIDPTSQEGIVFKAKFRESQVTYDNVLGNEFQFHFNKAKQNTDLWKKEEIARNNETYGQGMTLQSIQDLNERRKQEGIGFQKSAAEIARDIINGVKPTVATTQARQIADSGVASVVGMTGAQPNPDAALMNRNAQMAVQQQQRKAIMDTALARANEISEARKIAANAGLNIQGTGLTDYSNMLRTRGQLKQAAAQDQAAADAANRQNKAAEEAAGMQTVATAATIAAMALSDRNAKENIRFVGIDKNGLKTYLYRYKPELLDHPLAVEGDVYGYMADEVEALYPEAVFQAGKYKAVDYTKIPKGDE